MRFTIPAICYVTIEAESEAKARELLEKREVKYNPNGTGIFLFTYENLDSGEDKGTIDMSTCIYPDSPMEPIL